MLQSWYGQRTPLCILPQISLDCRDGKLPYLAAVEDTMIITMKGIAAGMQNTG